MLEIQSTKVPEMKRCCRLPYSAVDKLRIIEGLKGVNTMFQFEGNDFWYLGICLNGPRSRVSQNQKTPTVTEPRAPMPKPARV